MERVEGNRAGSTIYIDEQNYCYLNDHLSGNTRYFRCQLKQTCHGRAIWKTGDPVVVTTDHNHYPNVEQVQVWRYKQELRQRAASQLRPLRAIYDELQAEDPRGALAVGRFQGAVQQIMERARGKTFPPIPRSLLDIHTYLTNIQ